jgi:archaellum biogenesis ATPase FlaH
MAEPKANPETGGSVPDRAQKARVEGVAAIEDPMVHAMLAFSGMIDTIRAAHPGYLDSKRYFSANSKPPTQRETYVRIPAVSQALKSLAYGVYMIPAKSGAGKSTAALSLAMAIELFKLFAGPASPTKDKLAALLSQYEALNPGTEQEDVVKTIIKHIGTTFKNVLWLNINEPATVRMNVVGLLNTLMSCKESVVIIDSINDSLEEYARIFKEGARKGGWTYSQLELVSEINAFAEASKKVILITLNTDFFPLESMLGRTEGEVYPDLERGILRLKTRYTGRDSWKYNAEATNALALCMLGISRKQSHSDVTQSPVIPEGARVPSTSLEMA